MRLPALRESLAAAAIMILAGAFSAEAAAPPVQPAEGPGGIGDRKATVVKRLLGRGTASSYAFYATGAAPEGGRPSPCSCTAGAS